MANNKLRLLVETFDGRPDKGHCSTGMLIDSFQYTENPRNDEFNFVATSKNDKLKLKWAKGVQYGVAVFDGDKEIFHVSINAMGDVRGSSKAA